MLARDEIVIRRGRSDEQTQTEPSTCTVTVNNCAGRFTPRNPAGPYYGLIGRNTPLRVRVNAGFGVYTRFTGFISEWPPRWDPSENDNWISVTASGVLRRLSQGQSPLRSAIVSQVLYEAKFGYLRSYWPIEDGSESTVASPAYGSVGLTPVGVSFASVSGPAGSDPLPDLSSGGSLRTSQRLPVVGATEWRVEFLQLVDAVGGASHYPMRWGTTGSAPTWRVSNNNAGSVVLEAFSAGGTELLAGSVVASANVFSGRWVYVTVTAAQSGADLLLSLYLDDVVAGTSASGSGVLTGRTCGDIVSLQVNPLAVTSSSGLHSVGQVSLYTETTAISKTPALTGYAGTSAALRFAGVCARAGIGYDTSTAFLDSVAMGAQSRGSAISLLREVERADCGQLVERRTGELGFDPHVAWENRTVALVLDYDAGHISPPFEPVNDDRLTRNDVTVTRVDGVSGRVSISDGPLGTAALGTYDDQVTLNLYDDSQPVQVAGWLVNQGTVDEYRYPNVNLALHRSADLIGAWLQCDLGSRLTLGNLPRWITPDQADQILDGYTERLTNLTWDVTLNCSPYTPRHVAVLANTSGDTNEFLGYLVPDTCVLAGNVTSAAATMDVTSTPLWSTNADDYGPGIAAAIGGERVRVTGCTGAANPQTLTVARSVNGVVKAHTAGETLTLADPGVLGL